MHLGSDHSPSFLPCNVDSSKLRDRPEITAVLDSPIGFASSSVGRLTPSLGGSAAAAPPPTDTGCGTTDPDRAERWLHDTEGVVAKDMDAPYLPGDSLRFFPIAAEDFEAHRGVLS